jgi:hypothetical protein
MTVHTIARCAVAVLAGAAMFTVAACAGPAPSADPPPAPDAAAPDVVEGPGGGDYAFGTDRDQIAASISAAFSSKNGEARWDGDTLVLRIDGDATATIAGVTECHVLKELLNEGDGSVVEYPNGTLACADVLP